MEGVELLVPAPVGNASRAGLLADPAPRRRKAPAMHFLIVEAQSLVRHGLALAMKEAHPGAWAHEAATVEEAIGGAGRLPAVNLILLDIDGVAGAADAAVRKLSLCFRGVPVIVTCSLPDVAAARACLSAGARAVLLKSESTAVLAQTVNFVLSAGAYRPLPAWLGLGQLPRRPQEENPADVFGRLTPRQRQILVLLQGGASNKEIARDLGLLEGTVKVHIRAMMQKLGAVNRTQMALMAARTTARAA